MAENEVMIPEKQITAPAELSIEQVVCQVNKIKELMTKVMKKDEHYGVIPGTKKPSLLNPGAQKINFLFRLEPQFTIQRFDLPHEHREYQVKCDLYNIITGIKVGEGVGSCSTMESKYRYRNKYLEDEVGEAPKGYWEIARDNQKERDAFLVNTFGQGKYRIKKTEGKWKVLRVTGDGEKEENPDIADCYNTVLKMAKKRAYVDATLTATAASDFFTQDVEDFADENQKDNESGDDPTQGQRPAQGITPIQPGYMSPDYKNRSIALMKKLKVATAEIFPKHGATKKNEKTWIHIDWKAVYEDLQEREKNVAAVMTNTPVPGKPAEAQPQPSAAEQGHPTPQPQAEKKLIKTFDEAMDDIQKAEAAQAASIPIEATVKIGVDPTDNLKHALDVRRGRPADYPAVTPEQKEEISDEELGLF